MNRVSLLLPVVLSVFSLTSCQGAAACPVVSPAECSCPVNVSVGTDNESQSAVSSIKEPSVSSVSMDTFSIHTPVQKAFLDNGIGTVNLFARGVEELSRPATVTYSWEGGSAPYHVALAERDEPVNVREFDTDSTSIGFTNLKVATVYSVKVTSGENIVKEGIFATAEEIVRNLYVSGVTNVRDIGGYPLNGKRTKQGLIYRTGCINVGGAETPTKKINDKGIATMLNEMKVKSEIDLRVVSNNEVGGLTEGVGVLGEGVRYYQCPMSYSTGKTMESDLNDASLRKVFAILGDASNYPTFFHCAIGTDRTGYVGWLIDAFLGLEEEYLWRDYLFSNYGNIGGSRSISTIRVGYLEDLQRRPGSTWKEKTTAYLLEKGVKQEHLDTLSTMMLG